MKGAGVGVGWGLFSPCPPPQPRGGALPAKALGRVPCAWASLLLGAAGHRRPSLGVVESVGSYTARSAELLSLRYLLLARGGDGDSCRSLPGNGDRREACRCFPQKPLPNHWRLAVKCGFFPHPFPGHIQGESLWMGVTRIYRVIFSGAPFTLRPFREC